MDIRPLSKALQQKAEKEINEVPKKCRERLEILKIWLGKQQHLKYKNDDQLLINFLRCCKYNMERTKTKLDAYYTFRTVAPELSKGLDPLTPSMQNLLNVVHISFVPIPENDPASEAVVVLAYEEFGFDEVTPNEIIKFCVMLIETFFNENDNLIVCGVKVVWDFKNIPYNIIVNVTPSLIKKCLICVQHAYPMRIKGVYCINVPRFCGPLVSLIKYFSPSKFAKRVNFYSTSSLEVVYNQIPKSMLPTEYGGEAGPLAELSVKTKELVETHRKRLLEEDNYYSDETKRVEPSNYFESLFGVDGTFQKLEID